MAGLLERIQRIVLTGTGTLSELERQRTLNELADPRSRRVDQYRVYEGYYDGDYGAKLTGRLKEYVEQNGFGYVENFCETIVDALAERLELNTVVAEDDSYSEWISRLWQANRMDDLQGVVHTQVPMKGDGYVVVDWNDDTGLPRFTWNDPSLIRPVYDEHGRMLVAAKAWNESKLAATNPSGIAVRRLNLYFPERVEKWFTTTAIDDPRTTVQEAVWRPHQDLTDTEWPIPWVDAHDQPLGIAVGHFRNKPKGRDFGRSELHNVIPQQNALTKVLVDLLEVLDYQGAAQRWATGVKGGEYRSAPGTVWESENEGAHFGQFDPANPAGVLEAAEQLMRRMAARSRTPLHQLMTGGQNPTGETLRAANEPLVKKALDRQTSYGGVWVDRHVLAVKLQQLYDPSFRVPDDLQLTASWEAAQTEDEKGDLEAAAIKKDLGVSRYTLLTEMGYDPEFEAEKRQAEADEAMRAAQAAFAATGGVIPGQPSGAPADPAAKGNGGQPPPAKAAPPAKA